MLNAIICKITDARHAHTHKTKLKIDINKENILLKPVNKCISNARYVFLLRYKLPNSAAKNNG